MHKTKFALVNVLIAVSLIAIASFSYLAFVNHQRENDKSIELYSKNLRRLTRIISGSTELSFLTIDQTLRRATERQYINLYFKGNIWHDMERSLAAWVNKTPHIQAMFFTDENGIVQLMSRKGENNFDVKPGYMFSATNHFNYHKTHPEKELLISINKNTQQINGRIFISRRVEDNENQFRGLAVVVMDSNYLMNFLNSIEAGQSTEMYLLLNNEDFLTDNFPDSASKLLLLRAMMDESNFKSAGEGEIVVAERKINNSLSMFTFQKIPGLPITVAMIAQEKDIFADSRQVRNYYIALIIAFTIFVATVVIFTLLLNRKIQETEESEKKALLASQTKSDFLAKMSHELRTPLNAIIGFSEMLTSGYFGKVSATQAERLNDIHMCGNHLLALISDILEFSRGEANKLHLSEEEVDVHNIARQSLRMVEQKAKEQSVELVNAISRETPFIMADSRKLKQIIINLLSNSVKFTRPGGKIVVSSHFDAMHNFVITVSDTGIGIAPDDIPKAMAVFEQIHKDKGNDGTGLGLPLCKMLTELHSGTFKLESKLNVGTKASIILPGSRVRRRNSNHSNNSHTKEAFFIHSQL